MERPADLRVSMRWTLLSRCKYVSKAVVNLRQNVSVMVLHNIETEPSLLGSQTDG